MNDEGRRQAIHTDGAAGRGPAPGQVPTAADARNGVAARAAARVPLVTVTDAVKDFAGPRRHTKVRAVDGVSLSFDKRQTFGLVGESGSGKTTLARMVAGSDPADRRQDLPRGRGPAAHGRQARPRGASAPADGLPEPRELAQPQAHGRPGSSAPPDRLAGLDRQAASGARPRVADRPSGCRPPTSTATQGSSAAARSSGWRSPGLSPPGPIW